MAEAVLNHRFPVPAELKCAFLLIPAEVRRRLVHETEEGLKQKLSAFRRVGMLGRLEFVQGELDGQQVVSCRAPGCLLCFRAG